MAASGDAVDVGAGGAGGAGRGAGTAGSGGAEDEEVGAGAGDCDAGAINVSMTTGRGMRSAGARRCFKGVILNCFAAGPALAARRVREK